VAAGAAPAAAPFAAIGRNLLPASIPPHRVGPPGPLPIPSADSQSQQQDLLPTDYQYTWANDSYSKGQRTRDTWTFVLLLRARLWLLDQVSGRQQRRRRRCGAAMLLAIV
jgi:hypothetical protein